MVRTYHRKTPRPAYDQNRLVEALQAVSDGVSVAEASNRFKIPYGTLYGRVNPESGRNVKSKPGVVPGPSTGRRPVFTEAQEKRLCDHITNLGDIFYGLTPDKVKKLAFDYAEAEGLSHPFRNGTAGWDWYYGFLRRHPGLSLRQPEAMSLNRSIGFRQSEVQIFFENLGRLREEHGFSETHIWNCDETGVTTVTKPPKILARTGSKRVSAITSEERGVITTLIMACSAAGNFMAPFFVFKRKKPCPTLLNGAPASSKMAVSSNGWSTEESFQQWLQEFIRFTGSSVTNKQLLIVDNHFTHCNLNVWKLARDNGVVILSLPPHTSHKLQPLDVGYFGAFKANYGKEVSSWLTCHPGRKVTQYEIAHLVGLAYENTAKVSTGVNSFKETGICPFRPHKFEEADFAHVPATMELFQDAGNDGDGEAAEPTRTQDSTEAVEDEETEDVEEGEPEEIDPRSKTKTSATDALFELPRPSPRDRKRVTRKRASSVVVTGSPMKKVYEEKETKKRKKSWKDMTKKGKPTESQRKTKKTDGKKRRKTRTEDVTAPGDEPAETEEEDICLFCDEGVVGKNEAWIRCIGCGRWAHEMCSNGGTSAGLVCDRYCNVR